MLPTNLCLLTLICFLFHGSGRILRNNYLKQVVKEGSIVFKKNSTSELIVCLGVVGDLLFVFRIAKTVQYICTQSVKALP